ncbi:hypothetical protein AB0P21_07925 [Kribbella sp. NPDC056861]|uniref:hypothetical protein n=1 Tax=Kribbella sp. NPDC056861 TaxID=3154857 RepID=UPI00343D14AD
MSAVDERPTVYCFFYEDAFTLPRHAADSRGGTAEFAARWRNRLAKVFTEKPGESSRRWQSNLASSLISVTCFYVVWGSESVA